MKPETFAPVNALFLDTSPDALLASESVQMRPSGGIDPCAPALRMANLGCAREEDHRETKLLSANDSHRVWLLVV
jgi:hypothetical protein